MDTLAALSYVYAKCCGIIAKTFIGSRADPLFAVDKLSDLWRLISDADPPSMPEELFAVHIEKYIENRFIDDFTNLLSAFDKPDSLSLAYLRSFDYSNLKLIVRSLRRRRGDPPETYNIQPFQLFNLDAWPKLDKITANTPVSWLTEVPSSSDIEWENKLDKAFYAELWSAVRGRPRAGDSFAARIVKDEIILRNIIWSMRLRVYYDMSAGDIIPLLVSASSPAPSADDELAGPAVQCLSYAADDPSEWERWRWKDILNPAEERGLWTLDPRWCERAAKRKLTEAALHNYRQCSSSADILLCFFKIKQAETALVRTAVEGIRLQMKNSEVREFVEEC